MAPAPSAVAAPLKLYYERGSVKLYHGDGADLLRTIRPECAVVMDPVWPNADADLVGAGDPDAHFANLVAALPEGLDSLVVHLGRDSDPRVLRHVPALLPFVAACWLRRTPPGYKGTLLIGADVAYVWGHRRRPVGAKVMPAECQIPSTGSRVADVTHPCPRNQRGVAWLLRWYCSDAPLIVDPCAGSGTTLAAAHEMGTPCVGAEIDERWCEQAALRLDRAQAQQRLA